ncbi:MAG: NINE protein [Rubrivivax sp.]
MNATLAPEATSAKLADQKFCHACANVLHHTAAHCPRCGARQGGSALVVAAPEAAPAGVPAAPATAPGSALAPNHVYCRGCGAGIHESAPVCPKCGAPQAAHSHAAHGSSRNRTTAALLALLLGGLGAHKFYLGSIFVGLLYLCFFWTAIPAVIGFVEGIYYLTLSEQEFARRYG